MPKDKLKTIYVCTQCGETSPRWLGRCPSCGAWNTMTEDVVAEPAKASGGKAAAAPRVTGQTSLVAQKLKNISTTEEKSRIVTGISELDRVLGGGIVIGSVTLLGGAPGIRSARYCEGTDADRNAFLLKNMEGKEDRACRFVCAIACVLADGETGTVRGECEGELLHENHGAGGFGYDPLFYVPEYECTFGELEHEVKNRISHRARALGRLRDVLKDKI